MATQLKFICLNLWLGGKLRDNIVSFLHHEDADIIAVQEAEDFVAEGYPYVSFAPELQYANGQRDGQLHGNAVWSKFPITSSETIWFDVPYDKAYVPDSQGDFTHVPRNLLHCVIDVNGTALHVFNTQGIWGFDGDDNPRRVAMATVIAQAIKGKQPAVLAGDFNVQEKTESIALIEENMKSVFKGELKSSFNLRHKTDGGFATAVVDMMFVSSDIKVLEHHTTDEDVTDHIPLVASLEV